MGGFLVEHLAVSMVTRARCAAQLYLTMFTRPFIQNPIKIKTQLHVAFVACLGEDLLQVFSRDSCSSVGVRLQGVYLPLPDERVLHRNITMQVVSEHMCNVE